MAPGMEQKLHYQYGIMQVGQEYDWFLNDISGSILSNFPASIQPYCSPRVKEHIFFYHEEALCDCLPLQDAAHHALLKLKCWISLCYLSCLEGRVSRISLCVACCLSVLQP